MPSLGADMTEGTLLEWLVKPGDPVHRGDIVAVVDTSKSAVEVECFDDGVVDSLVVEPGTKVQVGTVLATLATTGGAVASASGHTHPGETDPTRSAEPSHWFGQPTSRLVWTRP